LGKEIGELLEIAKTVLSSVTDKTILSDKIDNEDQQNLTTGQKNADKVSTFGGS